jgi:hypothetical protein
LEDAGQREGLGRLGKEEMLGHVTISRLWEISYVISYGLVNSKISYMISPRFDRSCHGHIL